MATANEANNNLERVTDYVEERELDSDKMAQAMSGLQSGVEAQEEVLPAVKADKELTQFLVANLDVTEKLAKDALRRHENDLQETLQHLMRA